MKPLKSVGVALSVVLAASVPTAADVEEATPDSNMCFHCPVTEQPPSPVQLADEAGERPMVPPVLDIPPAGRGDSHVSGALVPAIELAMMRARQMKARVLFVCDTRQQADDIAERAGELLPEHNRIAFR